MGSRRLSRLRKRFGAVGDGCQGGRGREGSGDLSKYGFGVSLVRVRIPSGRVVSYKPRETPSRRPGELTGGREALGSVRDTWTGT